MNLFVGIGYVYGTPKLKYTKTGIPYCTLLLVAQNEFISQDGKVRKTKDFLPCIRFGRLAEALSTYLVSGSQIAVEGYVSNKKILKPNNKETYRLDILIKSVRFLNGCKTNKDVLEDPIETLTIAELFEDLYKEELLEKKEND